MIHGYMPCIHTYIHTFIHTCIHTHIHTPLILRDKQRKSALVNCVKETHEIPIELRCHRSNFDRMFLKPFVVTYMYFVVASVLSSVMQMDRNFFVSFTTYLSLHQQSTNENTQNSCSTSKHKLLTIHTRQFV